MSKITTGCDRCDNFYSEIIALNYLLWTLEDKKPDWATKARISEVKADVKLQRAKLDEHIILAHQLTIPF